MNWLPAEATSLATFEAENGPERVALEWETLGEVDVDAFLVDAAASPGGPWAPVVELAPQGQGLYTWIDAPLPADVPRHYRLSQRLTHGVVQEFAQAQATPYSAALPDNILTVGPNGSHATIQAAVNAAGGPRVAILVEPGTYASFAIDAPIGALHVFADGAGPVRIDTASGPVLVRGVGFTQSVELSGLIVGDPASPSDGVLIEDCAGAVILDELEVHGGSGLCGVRAARSTAVSLQTWP